MSSTTSIQKNGNNPPKEVPPEVRTSHKFIVPYQNLQIPFFLPLDLSEIDREQLKSYATWFLNVLPERLALLTSEVHATPGYETWQADFSVQSLDTLGNWLSDRLKALEPRFKTVEEILEGVKNWFFQYVVPDPNHNITPESAFNVYKTWYLNALPANAQPEKACEIAMEWFYKNIGEKQAGGSEDFEIMEDQWLTITHGKQLDPISISFSADVGMYLSKVFYLFVKQNYPQIKWHPAFGTYQYRHFYPHAHVLEYNELMVNFDPLSTMIDIGFSMHEGSKSGAALCQLFELWASCLPIYAEQLPILEELAAIGVKIKSIWDFRYAENPEEREFFAQAIPILCKHLKVSHHPYIQEALAAALAEEELGDQMSAQAALDVLEGSDSLPHTVHQFLILAALQGDDLQQQQAQKYIRH